MPFPLHERRDVSTGTFQVAQQVKTLASNPEGLSSISGTHTMEEEN